MHVKELTTTRGCDLVTMLTSSNTGSEPAAAGSGWSGGGPDVNAVFHVFNSNSTLTQGPTSVQNPNSGDTTLNCVARLRGMCSASFDFGPCTCSGEML